MYIDRIIYPIYTLGPGKRLVVWFLGCSKKCKGCANSELWEKKENKKISVDSVKKIIEKIISKNNVNGITLTGGDPLEQNLEELLELIKSIKELKNIDILLYTGYAKKEIEKDKQKKKILKEIDVLIDGRYIEEQNNNKVELRGSKNQKIYYINKNIREKYEEYMKQNGRKVQNIYYNGKLISVGIHNKLGKGKQVNNIY